MKLKLSIPVGINQLYKSTKHGWYKDQKAVDWQEEAVWEILLQGKRQEKPTGEIVRITWFFSDKRRRDIDSGLKLLLDTLVKANILTDDSVIKRLEVTKAETEVKNYCEVEII